MKLSLKTLAALLAIISAAALTVTVFAETEAPALDGSETLLAAYISGCEKAKSLPAMVAVGAVLLHRCRNASYPNTISANGASLGILPSASPSPMSEYAAHLALSGLDPTFGALSFFDSESAASHPGAYVTFSVCGLCFAK